jgi:hydroxyacylglutathione hydrolase
MALQVETLQVGPFQVNCYLLWDNSNLEGVIIDPGAEPSEIFRAVKLCGFTPNAILLTHGHGDHIGAVDEVREKYTAPLYIGSGEEVMLSDPLSNMSAFFDSPIKLKAPEFLATDEQHLVLGSLQLTVLSTPGHTAAGVCYLHETEGLLFCGDTLFQGSVGRTDLPGGSMSVLLDSIQKKILTLPDSIICYPGHGPRTTVGAERHNNPFLLGAHLA